MLARERIRAFLDCFGPSRTGTASMRTAHWTISWSIPRWRRPSRSRNSGHVDKTPDILLDLDTFVFSEWLLMQCDVLFAHPCSACPHAADKKIQSVRFLEIATKDSASVWRTSSCFRTATGAGSFNNPSNATG